MSNLRQLGTGGTMYVQDNNGFVPVPNTSSYLASYLWRDGVGEEYYPLGRLLKGYGLSGSGAYVPSPDVFICPTATGEWWRDYGGLEVIRNKFEKSGNVRSSYVHNISNLLKSSSFRLSNLVKNGYIWMADLFKYYSGNEAYVMTHPDLSESSAFKIQNYVLPDSSCHFMTYKYYILNVPQSHHQNENDGSDSAFWTFSKDSLDY
jgi:hypothetical protein